MKRVIVLTFIAFISAIFYRFLISPVYPALTMTNGRTKQLVFAERIQTGQSFSIQFIHSIHRTPVQEKYHVDGNLNIVLDELIYESYGVGNPSGPEAGQTFREENGKFIIGNMKRVLPYFDQAIGQIIANHQLELKGNWVPLSQYSPPGSWVRIQAKKVSAWQLWTAHPKSGT
jgi:hypothetical protein